MHTLCFVVQTNLADHYTILPTPNLLASIAPVSCAVALVVALLLQCYGRIDEDGSRYLLGDYMGGLHLMVLAAADDRVAGIKLQQLGEGACLMHRVLPSPLIAVTATCAAPEL